MNISEFEKPANEKLAKINEALDTSYGSKVYDTIDIQKLYDAKKDPKTKLKELEAFHHLTQQIRSKVYETCIIG